MREGRKLYSHDVQRRLSCIYFFPKRFFYCFFICILGVRYLWQYYCCSFGVVAKQRHGSLKLFGWGFYKQ